MEESLEETHTVMVRSSVASREAKRLQFETDAGVVLEKEMDLEVTCPGKHSAVVAPIRVKAQPTPEVPVRQYLKVSRIRPILRLGTFLRGMELVEEN